MIPLGADAPTPDTDSIGVQVFRVTQTSVELGCESVATEIIVTVKPAPENDFVAASNKVCPQTAARITLEKLDPNHVYSAYAAADPSATPVASFTGAESGVLALDDLLENDARYYIRRTDAEGCVSATAVEVTAEVAQLYLLPETLPPYERDRRYSQTFLTNAKRPVFRLDGALPAGLSLDEYGELSGVAYERDKVSEITVTVTDVNGCDVSRSYVLSGYFFVPKVFTPNGDGVNDIFMETYRVIIFDRLGVEMHVGDNGWDGTYKNKPAPTDIYFYKIFVADPETGTTTMKTGYVGIER